MASDPEWLFWTFRVIDTILMSKPAHVTQLQNSCVYECTYSVCEVRNFDWFRLGGRMVTNFAESKINITLTRCEMKDGTAHGLYFN